MFLKSLINYAKRRLGLLIMHVLRSGKISRMTINLIFGHLDAPFIKWLHFTLHFWVRIFKKFTNPLHKAAFHLSLFITQMNFIKQYRKCCKNIRKNVFLHVFFSIFRIHFAPHRKTSALSLQKFIDNPKGKNTDDSCLT